MISYRIRVLEKFRKIYKINIVFQKKILEGGYWGPDPIGTLGCTHTKRGIWFSFQCDNFFRKFLRFILKLTLRVHFENLF